MNKTGALTTLRASLSYFCCVRIEKSAVCKLDASCHQEMRLLAPWPQTFSLQSWEE